ncbi:retinoic acid receptor gamma-like, partial [Dreissena polymorpha]
HSPPCQVCEGVSSGIHFGCYTCEACKNFFRRCLKRKREENIGLKKSRDIFTCPANKKCDTTHGTAKNNCSACRFDKCLNLGMATEKVKKGRISYAQRTETIKQVRMLEGKEVIVSPNEASTRATAGTDKNSTVSTALDMCEAMLSRNISKLQDQCENVRVSADLVESLVQNMDKMKIMGEEMSIAEVREARIKEHYENYMTKVAMFGSMSGVSKDEYHNLLKNYDIDLDDQWKVFKDFALNLESVIGRYCRFAKQLPNFAKLSLNDQVSLLKHTHCDFFILMLHKGYKPEYNIFLELNGLIYHVEEASDRLLSRNSVSLMVQMFDRLQKLNLTDGETALVGAIITMSSDQCELENSTLVESTQLDLCNLLRQNMKDLYGERNGSIRFAKIVDRLTTLREVSVQYYKDYRSICEDKLVQKETPLFDILLPDNDV